MTINLVDLLTGAVVLFIFLRVLHYILLIADDDYRRHVEAFSGEDE